MSACLLRMCCCCSAACISSVSLQYSAAIQCDDVFPQTSSVSACLYMISSCYTNLPAAVISYKFLQWQSPVPSSTNHLIVFANCRQYMPPCNYVNGMSVGHTHMKTSVAKCCYSNGVDSLYCCLLLSFSRTCLVALILFPSNICSMVIAKWHLNWFRNL